MKVKVGTRCFGHFNNIFKVTYIHNSFPSGIRLIKKQGLLKWWNEQNISARDSRAELSCEGRVGSTLACLGTSWRKSRVQYDCKHSSEVDEREDSGTQKFNSPQVKSIGCLLRCLRAVGRYWEEETGGGENWWGVGGGGGGVGARGGGGGGGGDERRRRAAAAAV